MTLAVFKTIGECAWLIILAAMMVMLIRRKRAGQWKRPRTFPIAMTLLGIAMVSYSAALVLSYLGA
jgi:hypothetical protein